MAEAQRAETNLWVFCRWSSWSISWRRRGASPRTNPKAVAAATAVPAPRTAAVAAAAAASAWDCHRETRRRRSWTSIIARWLRIDDRPMNLMCEREKEIGLGRTDYLRGFTFEKERQVCRWNTWYLRGKRLMIRSKSEFRFNEFKGPIFPPL